jgi:hypothetical protein
VPTGNRRQQCRLAIVGSSADNSLIYQQYNQHRRLLAADPFSNAHGFRDFFENGAAAFEKADRRHQREERKRVDQLEAKLQTKNEVLAELMKEVKKRYWFCSAVESA